MEISDKWKQREEMKVKKIISLLLVLVIATGLCACGGNSKLSKEEMLSQAEELNQREMLVEMDSNINRAETNYNDKIVSLSDITVADISSDHITTRNGYNISGIDVSMLIIDVYLSDEDMVKVNKYDEISVVGVLKIVSSRSAELHNAYLIEN